MTSTVVLYKSKYGASKQYAEWIAEELGCKSMNIDEIKFEDIWAYKTIILGGGLYANNIAGANFLLKHIDELEGKNVVFYTVGITPLNCRDYYERLVIEKTFPEGLRDKYKVFNFLGKMLTDELTFAHKMALKTLKKIMQGKENPTEMEKMLVDLCDYNKDETSKEQINELIEYVRSNF